MTAGLAIMKKIKIIVQCGTLRGLLRAGREITLPDQEADGLIRAKYAELSPPEPPEAPETPDAPDAPEQPATDSIVSVESSQPAADVEVDPAKPAVTKPAVQPAVQPVGKGSNRRTSRRK